MALPGYEKLRNQSDSDLYTNPPSFPASSQPRRRYLLYTLIVLLFVSNICTWFISQWQIQAQQSSDRSFYGM